MLKKVCPLPSDLEQTKAATRLVREFTEFTLQTVDACGFYKYRQKIPVKNCTVSTISHGRDIPRASSSDVIVN